MSDETTNGDSPAFVPFTKMERIQQLNAIDKVYRPYFGLESSSNLFTERDTAPSIRRSRSQSPCVIQRELLHTTPSSSASISIHSQSILRNPPDHRRWITKTSLWFRRSRHRSARKEGGFEYWYKEGRGETICARDVGEFGYWLVEQQKCGRRPEYGEGVVGGSKTLLEGCQGEEGWEWGEWQQSRSRYGRLTAGDPADVVEARWESKYGLRSYVSWIWFKRYPEDQLEVGQIVVVLLRWIFELSTWSEVAVCSSNHTITQRRDIRVPRIGRRYKAGMVNISSTIIKRLSSVLRAQDLVEHFTKYKDLKANAL